MAQSLGCGINNQLSQLYFSDFALSYRLEDWINKKYSAD